MADQVSHFVENHLMTRKSVGRRFAVALSVGLWMAGNASAVQVTLNLVQPQSFLTVDGSYAGYDFYAQDDPAFPTFPASDPENTVTDYDPAQPSNRTTLTGSITVDVDNVLAPNTIQILSAYMHATATGEWLPKPYFDGDYNEEGANNVDVDAADYVVGRKFPDNFGGDPAWYNSWRQQYGEPDGGSTTAQTIPAPALPADIGVKLVADFGIPECCDIAYAALRDLSYNLVTADLETSAPIVEPVNDQGEFSSLSQIVNYRTGYFDYWADPFLINEQARDPVSGDGAPNQHNVDASVDPEVITPIPNAPKSTYIVSGNLVTLTIPVDINISNPTDISYFIHGQLVATFDSGFGGSSAVPEPTGAVFVVVGCAALLLRRRPPRR
jgi:hypothetical protein